MSSTLEAYVVSLDKLNQVIGSASQQLIDAILVSDGYDMLTSVDDIDDQAGYSLADAISFLINGAIDVRCPGYLYGYGLEAICATIGKPLPNICGIARASDWIQRVDAILSKNKVPIGLSNLVYSGSAVPIPIPDDYPYMGQWPADVLLPLLNAMRSIDVAKLGDDGGTIVQMQGWLTEGLKRPEHSIVGFLS